MTRVSMTDEQIRRSEYSPPNQAILLHCKWLERLSTLFIALIVILAGATGFGASRAQHSGQTTLAVITFVIGILLTAGAFVAYLRIEAAKERLLEATVFLPPQSA
jgi:hypothetical protein